MVELENAFKAASYRYHPRRIWKYGAAFRFVFAVMGLVGLSSGRFRGMEV